MTLAGCSTFETRSSGVTYVFTNRCGEELLVRPISGDDQVTLANGATRAIRTADQEPDAAFVVSRPDGTDEIQVIAGTSTVTITGDQCPTDETQ